MDINTVERLHKLFANKDFLDANKDKETLDEIYEAVIALEPTVTKEELDQYLLRVSELMASQGAAELSAEDLEQVAGGSIIVTWGMVCGIIGGTYAVCSAIGQAIAHWHNRRG